MKGNGESEYGVLGVAAPLVGVLVLVLVACGSDAANQEAVDNRAPVLEISEVDCGPLRLAVAEVTPPYLLSAREVIEEHGVTRVEMNLRHPQGEIVESAPDDGIIGPGQAYFDAAERMPVS